MTSMLSAALGWLGLRSMENPRVPLDPWHEQGGQEVGGDLSGAGVRLNRSRALTVAAVWRAVHLVSDAVAKLPLGVYRAEGQNRIPDPEHPAHYLLRVRPNPYMTPYTFKRTLTAHVLLEGNAYAYVYRSASGRPLDLLVLGPRRTEPVMVEGRLWYVHTLRDGRKRKLPADDVLCLPGLGADGLKGYSVIAHARESLGLAVATTSYGGTFFRNNARPNLVLKHPNKLSPEARKNLRESWERLHSGLDNAHRTAILEEGMTAEAVTINARDAQLIESKQFSLIDVANWFGVPANKLGANVSTSYGSLEQDNQHFLDHGIDPRLVVWEEECEAKLLTDKERQGYTHAVSFDRFPLQRADSDKRANYYQKAISTGWMSPDEARAREGMNPQPDGVGAVYARPLNLAFVGGPGADAPATASGLIPLPDVRQREAWDCGPAAVAAVVRHFGRSPDSLDALAAAMGTTPERGTTPAAVAAQLSRAGLTVTSRSGMTADDLARFFAAGQPVLCPVRPGHWVAVAGVGLGMVFFQDPAAGPRMLPLADWAAGWSDADADGNAYEAFGIAAGEGLLPAGGPPAAQPPDPEPDPEPDGGVKEAARAVLLEAAGRAVNRLGHAAGRAAGKPASFLAWLDRMGADHEPTVRSMLAAPLAAWSAAGGTAADPAALAAALVSEVRGGLLAVAGSTGAAGLSAAVAGYFAGVAGDAPACVTGLCGGVSR